jgi:hypothetical protein
MKFTRNMTQGYFQEWAAASHSQAEAQAEDFRVVDRVEAFQAEASQEDQEEDSKAEELQHHRRHLSFLKNPRHQPLLLIQAASEGACTDIRMFG